LAALANIIEAQFIVSNLYEWKDAKKSERFMRMAAEAGHPAAQVRLGKTLLDRGYKQEAFNWFVRASEQENVDADLQLAKLYLKDNNYAQALSYFVNVADNGSAEGMFELANLYSEGCGVEKNPKKAKELIQQAAMFGHPAAQKLIGEISGVDLRQELRKMRSLGNVEEKKESVRDDIVMIPEPGEAGLFFKMTGNNKYQRILLVFAGPIISFFADEDDSYPSELCFAKNVNVSVPKDTIAVKGRSYMTIHVGNHHIQLYSTEDSSVRSIWVRKIRRAAYFYTHVDPGRTFQERKEEDVNWDSSMLQEARKTGWLVKQGGKRKNWNKRFFVLVGDSLYYFKDEKSKTASGVIPIAYSTVKPGEAFSIKKPHVIGIISLFRNFFLQATHVLEAKQWMVAIQEQIDVTTPRDLLPPNVSFEEENDLSQNSHSTD